MHRVPVSLVLLIAAAAASTAAATAANMPPPGYVGADATDDEVINSPLEIVNPWLSACDLAQPATAPDLQGTCSTATPVPASLWISEGPGPPSAREQDQDIYTHRQESPPTPCSPSSAPRNASTTSNQCLYYLEESHKKMVCEEGQNRAWRFERLVELRLKHCCEHSVLSALANHLLEDVLAGGEQCRFALQAILDTDALAARITCEFTEVLTRYDCGQPYSIVYHCDDCKEAYRRWVCSSLVPHFANTNSGSSSNTTTSTTSTAAVGRGGSSGGVGGGSSSSSIGSGNGRRRVRPCRSVCQTVEQRCPYLLPGDRAPAHPTQYAGEPTFLCLDPNIPETGKQALKSSHGSEDCCYTYCKTKGVCAKCLDTATPDVATLYNDTSWRVRCTTTPNVPSGATSSSDMRASNCPSKQQQTTVVVVVTAQQQPLSDDDDNVDVMNAHTSAAATSSSTAAVTMHAQAYYLKTIQISIFAVAWTAVWTNNNIKLIITLTVIINTFVLNTFIGLLLIFVNSGYQLFKFNKHIRAGNKKSSNIYNNVLVAHKSNEEEMKKDITTHQAARGDEEEVNSVVVTSEFYLKSKSNFNCDGDYNKYCNCGESNIINIIMNTRRNDHETKINYYYYDYEKNINNICSFTFTKKCS